MRYFFSAATGYRKLLFAAGAKNFLLSFAVDAKNGLKHFTDPSYNILIDSGAFTTWTKGHAVDLDKYIDFCFGVRAVHPDAHFVGLDEIPGRYGTKPTKADIIAATKKTLANLEYCLSKGLVVIPVYHQFEPLVMLDEYLARVEYVGLSPANDQPIPSRMAFCETAYAHVGRAFKAHSFGFAPKPALERFPFYSVDTTSWQMGLRYRRIRTPHGSSVQIADTIDDRLKLKWARTGFDLKTSTIGIVSEFINEERYITELWRKRGITWV